MALFLNDLQYLKCQVPGCNHENHGRELYLHSRCHTGAKQLATLNQKLSILKIACAACGGYIAEIAVEQNKCNPCNKHTGQDVVYLMNEGKLRITCGECEKLIGEMSVRDY